MQSVLQANADKRYRQKLRLTVGLTVGCKASQRLVGTCEATWKGSELAEVDTDSDGVTRFERKFDSAPESENAIVDSASAR